MYLWNDLLKEVEIEGIVMLFKTFGGADIKMRRVSVKVSNRFHNWCLTLRPWP